MATYGLYLKPTQAKIYEISQPFEDNAHQWCTMNIKYELSGGWLINKVVYFEVIISKNAVIDKSDVEWLARKLVREENNGHIWELQFDIEMILTLK